MNMILEALTRMLKRYYKNLQGSGFVKMDRIASSTFVIVRAGLQLSFMISKLTLPDESTLQWKTRVLNTTCKTDPLRKRSNEIKRITASNQQISLITCWPSVVFISYIYNLFLKSMFTSHINLWNRYRGYYLWVSQITRTGKLDEHVITLFLA